MNVCVLTLTRDRLDYTKHCIRTLRENAGCDFDHFIFDNGSEDGTYEWLQDEYDADRITAFCRSEENIGICPALNVLLDDLDREYDVVVKIDNDCELVTPNTLADVCELAGDRNMILSPHIRGLRQTPESYATNRGVSLTSVVGGIFMAVPGHVFADGYRHPETTPLADGDDWQLCRRWQARHGLVGYVDGYEAWHYETTDGQHKRHPDYWARRNAEREAAGLVPA